jgi:hypothetical protein
VITLFLLPGFAFICGLYASPTVNRDASNISAPITFAIVLATAIAANSSLALAYWLNACLFGAPGHFCGPYPASMLTGLLLADALTLVGASLGLSIWLFMVGRWVYGLIESGALHTPLLHGWAYDYVRNREPKVAFVLTSIGADNQRVGYEGTLHSLRIGSDGAIRTVTLKDVSRFRVDFGNAPAKSRVRIDDPGNPDWLDTDLTIEGTKIDNIAIRTIRSPSLFDDLVEP